MRLIFNFLLCLLFISAVQATPITIISLGGSCTVATVLRTLELRKAAYPFDWIYSRFHSLLQAFETDFKDFLNPDFLSVSADKKQIIDTYGFQFVHDFPTITHEAALQELEEHQWAEIRSDWRNFIQPIREKYFKRIDRLRKVCKSNNTVYFVRYSISREEAIKLADVIARKFPSLTFLLIAVNPNKLMADPWNIQNIRNYYIDGEGNDFWRDWKNIFNDLGIKAQ